MPHIGCCVNILHFGHTSPAGRGIISFKVRIVVVILSVAENVCGESWHLVGNSCLKFITAKDSYDNAKLACRSHNAVLASLTTQKKVDFVLKELQIMSVVVRTDRLTRAEPRPDKRQDKESLITHQNTARLLRSDVFLISAVFLKKSSFICR